MKKWTGLLIVMLFVVGFSMTTLAAGGPYTYTNGRTTVQTSQQMEPGNGMYFRDVSRARLSADDYAAIAYIDTYRGWRGLTRRNRLYPYRFMTRREVVRLLRNLYPDDVKITKEDSYYGRQFITSQWLCARLSQLAEDLGCPIEWYGYSSQMRRKDVARYIKMFAGFDPAFEPIGY